MRRSKSIPEKRLVPLRRTIGRIIVSARAPLEPPKVARRLTKMPALERAIESIRYSALSAEFWISPDGVLRQWLRFVLRIGAFLGIPLIVLAPLITILLGLITGWTAAFLQIATNVLSGLAVTIAVAALLSLVVFAVQRIRGK